jgi:predicted RNase H-like HicB family nuclease
MLQHGIGAFRAGERCSILLGAGLYSLAMNGSLTLTAVFTPDENSWTMAQLAAWSAVVTCGRTIDEAREMLLDAAHEMIASYREEGREAPDRWRARRSADD